MSNHLVHENNHHSPHTQPHLTNNQKFEAAKTYFEQEEFQKAEKLLLEIKDKQYDNHDKDLDEYKILTSLALLYSRMGEHEKALPYFQELLKEHFDKNTYTKVKSLSKENPIYEPLIKEYEVNDGKEAHGKSQKGGEKANTGFEWENQGSKHKLVSTKNNPVCDSEDDFVLGE